MVIDESGSADAPFGRVGFSGQISVNDAWSNGISVSGFVDPVIVISPLSYTDAAPAVSQVDLLSSTFRIKVDEWDYLDGSHANETLNYLVIEAGQHMLDDGTIIEAGTIEVDSDGAWVSFDETFDTAPIILTQVMTNNETAAVTVRTSDLSMAGFNVVLQEEEAADGIHASETVSYIAITQTPPDAVQEDSGKTFDGSSSDVIFQAGLASADDTWDTITYESGRFSSTPLLFASMQSTEETDTAALRYQNASLSGVQLMVEEETSNDGETTHASESIGFLAIESGQIWVDVNDDNQQDTIFEAEIEACKAVNQKLIEQGYGDVADVVVIGYGTVGRYLDLDPEASGMQFHTTPNADTNGQNGYDVEEALIEMTFAYAQSTNFEAGLQYSLEALENDDNAYVDPADPNYDPIDDGLGPAIKNGSNGNVLFMSDGGHNTATYFLDEVDELKGTEFEEGWADNVRAFGVGQGAVLDQSGGSLTQIDPNAERFMTPYGLIQAMVNAIDTDGDGERDYVEPGMSGVTVYIDADNDGVFDEGVETSTTTDANGNYSFDSLGAGTYIIRQVEPSDFTQTYPAYPDPLPDPLVTTAHSVTIAVGEDVYNVNFGNNYGTDGNLAAVAVDDSASTDEDTQVSINVLANDNVPSGRSLYFSRVNQPEHGTATWNGSTVDYTPDLDWNGADTFSYVVTLGGGEYFKATVTVTVNPMPDGPRITKVEVGNESEMVEIPTGTDNRQLLPVTIDGGVDQVKITFYSPDGPLDNNSLNDVRKALTVNGRTSATEGWGEAKGVVFNQDRTEATWFFDADPYKSGEMVLKLSDTITTDDIALDGEWSGPVAFTDDSGNSMFGVGYASGNGQPGGDFLFNFTLPNTLKGDADRDGDVDNDDAAIMSQSWLMGPGSTWSMGDFDGDGYVNEVDATYWAVNDGQHVWFPPANAASFGVGIGGELSGFLYNADLGQGDGLTFSVYSGASYGDLDINADGSFGYEHTSGSTCVDEFVFRVSCNGETTLATATIYVGDAPKVTSVTVKNSSTAQQVVVPTNAGGDDQIDPIQITGGVDQIIIEFDRAVTAAIGDLKLNGVAANDFEMDGTTCTWTFPTAFQQQQMTIVLSDDVKNGDIPLDGDWTNPSYYDDNSDNSTFAGGGKSGDGVPGGDFVFNFNLTSGNWLTPPLAYDASYIIETEAELSGTMFGHAASRPEDVTFSIVDYPDHDYSFNFNPADGTFTYVSDEEFVGVDYFTFKTWDGYEDSEPATVTIYVGDAPMVTGVAVGNSVTSTSMAIQTADDSDIQIRPLKFYEGLDQISITFNHSVTIAASYLTLYLPGSTILSGSYADDFDQDGNTYTWTFSTDLAEPFRYGAATIVLSDSVNTNGIHLDGEWTNPDHYGDISDNSTFEDGGKSGNGSPGGDFVFNFSMLLPGDANCDGIVDSLDAAELAENWQTPAGATWADGDFNDDGAVDEIDATILGANWAQTVQTLSVPAPLAPLSYEASFEVETDGAIAGDLYLLGHTRGRDYGVTYYRVDQATYGSATVNTDGSFTYTPTTGYNGVDTFTFRTYDGVEYSDPVTVTIYVGDAPTVAAVYVQNSTTYDWAEIATAADGYDQLIPVPIYAGINAIWIEFDRSVTVTQDDLTLIADGVTLDGADADSFVTYGTICEWTFSTEGPFKFGPMTIELSDAVNTYGLALDGEWTNPEYYGDNTDNSTFDSGLTSGNGQRGGDFVFNFSMLHPGDTDCDGDVDGTDLSNFSSGWYGPDGADPQNPSPSAHWTTGDFNFDGYVNSDDLAILSANWGTTVWPEPMEMMAMGGGLESQTLSSTSSFRTIDSRSSTSALDLLFEQYGFSPSSTATQPLVGSDEWNDFIDDIFAVFDHSDLYESDLFARAETYENPHLVSNELLGGILDQFELVEN